MSQAVGNSPVFWVLLLGGLAAGYVLPTRQVESIPMVIILNCLPIAWPAALLLACTLPRRDDQ